MIEELMLVENPYYRPRRKSRRNKVSKNPTNVLTKQWLQGVGAMDAGAALGGLAASMMLPGMLVKDATTNTGKILTLVASVGSAIAAGFIFRNISATAGKMAIAGGLAGALTKAVGMYTDIKIGGSNAISTRTMRQIRQTTVPEFEDVRVN